MASAKANSQHEAFGTQHSAKANLTSCREPRYSVCPKFILGKRNLTKRRPRFTRSEVALAVAVGTIEDAVHTELPDPRRNEIFPAEPLTIAGDFFRIINAITRSSAEYK